MSIEYWACPIQELFKTIESRQEGLSNEEVILRQKKFGFNEVIKSESFQALSLFIDQFRSPLIWILLFAVTVSLGTREWTDAIVIAGIVFLSSILGFIQEYRASSAVKKLLARVAHVISVRRNGQIMNIPARDIVPGDIILLSAGTMIPADGVLIESKDIFTNEAALTGEPFPVEKHAGVSEKMASLGQQVNTVFMGTSVQSGLGTMLAISTGAHTHFGKISVGLGERHAITNFELGLKQFGMLLMKVMIIFVLAITIGNYFLNKPLVELLLFSIALAVGLSPELLPAVLSLTLTKGALKMAQVGVIIRRLNSIESLGSMDVLCCDKTGTLTEGQVVLSDAVDCKKQSSDKIGKIAYLNAIFQTGMNNPLDSAIISSRWATTELLEKYKKIDEIPYDFNRKILTVVVREKILAKFDLLIAKGAVANILAVCTQVRNASQIEFLTEEYRNELSKNVSVWGEQGLRVIGIATSEGQAKQVYHKDDEKNLIFEGFLLLKDPPHPEARQTLMDLQKLGVEVKIITGDNRYVAQSVASAVGLTLGGILTGSEMVTMTDEQFHNAVCRNQLFVEVDPQQKHLIVAQLKKMGHIVGYMGDGINDASALKEADVGISVESAVDVAKESADVILQKHDLRLVHDGLVIGRATFANTLKYIFVTTSANFGNMISMALASLVLPFLPLLATQILLNNFLSDLPALAIGTDRIDPEWQQKPHRWNLKNVKKYMIGFGLISSAFDIFTFLILLFVLKVSPEAFRTSWFVESLLTEILIIFVVRTSGPFYKSRPARGLILLAVSVALIAIFLPYTPLANIFELQPLPLTTMALMISISFVYVGTSEALKKRLFPPIE